MRRDATPLARHPSDWQLRPLVSVRTVALLAVVFIVLSYSAHRIELMRFFQLSSQAFSVLIGDRASSQVSDSVSRIVDGFFPPELATREDVSRLPSLDRTDLPWGAYIEVRQEHGTAIDPRTMEMTTREVTTEVLVRPYGYLEQVLLLMLETIEIAIWGTVLALLIAVPMAYLSAAGYTPNRWMAAATRSVSSFLRAVPELISALLLVLIFGFGALAGVLALGLHTAGFLAKFFADEIENAPAGPQHALQTTGANPLKVLRFAVLPQVAPAYLAYSQYVLERNIRSATVIGIVGAGGIGQELKGRFEMFDFGHVSTILLIIFATVLLLEMSTSGLRRRVIQSR